MSGLLPPNDIGRRSPVEYRVEAGATLSRFYQQQHEPLFFDRSTSGRLNAPDGSYGVLYAALTRRGSFAETFLRRPGNTIIASDFIAARAHVTFRVQSDLILVKAFGNGLAPIGATAEVTHGSPPYEAPQRWSHALHAHPTRFDGIAYQARHNDSEVCIAVFERAADKIKCCSRETDLDRDWFYELAHHHGVGVAPGDD